MKPCKWRLLQLLVYYIKNPMKKITNYQTNTQQQLTNNFVKNVKKIIIMADKILRLQSNEHKKHK